MISARASTRPPSFEVHGVNARMKVSLSLDETQQLFPIELDHLAGFDGPDPRQSSATGQHRAFAGKLRGPLGNDQRFGSGGWSHYFYRAARHNEERYGTLSYLDEYLTRRDRTSLPVSRDAGDLCRR